MSCESLSMLRRLWVMRADNQGTIRSLVELDIREVAMVHLVSFPQSALLKLGREAVARYYALLLRGAHDCLALGAFDGW